jgi:hypothetical protein
MRSLIATGLMILAASPNKPSFVEMRQPIYLGDDTAVRKALMNVDLSYSFAYTSATGVVLVRAFFRGKGAQQLAEVKTIHPLVVPVFHLQDRVTEEEKQLLLRTRFTIIYFWDDRRTCVVNELKGAQVREGFWEQDRTAVDVPCEKMFDAFETLRSVPNEDRKLILGLIPPIQPSNSP